MRRVFLTTAIASAATVYWGLLRNYFLGDDFVHLFAIVNEPFVNVATEPWGGHVLVVPHTLIGLLFAVFGPHPRPFFLAVLATHLVNVSLLFFLTERLTGRVGVACALALLWGTSPVVEGALGWLSVYGQVLVGTFVLGALVDLARCLDLPHVGPGHAAFWCAMLLLATLSFGTGLGLALVFPVVALILLPWKAMPPRTVLLILAIPPIALVAYFGVHWIHASQALPGELVVTPRGMLSAPATMATFATRLTRFSFQALAEGWTANTPLAGLKSGWIIWLLATAGAAGVCRPTRRGRATLVAILMLAAAYGSIAAGRASFYAARMSTDPSASPESLLRYHYVGSLFASILLALVAASAADCLALSTRVRRGIFLGFLTLGATSWLRSSREIDHHFSARFQTEQALQSVRKAVAAVEPGETVYIENAPFDVGGGAMRSLPPQLFAGLASVFCIFFPPVVEGHRVLFVIHDIHAFQALTARPERRIASTVTRGSGSP